MSIRYDTAATEPAMKTPILASLFNAIGWFVVLATAFLVIAAFSRQDKIASIPAVFVIGGSGGLIALAFLGTGQVLTSIANIEFYASTQKNEAILVSLHKIEGHLAALRENKKDA